MISAGNLRHQITIEQVVEGRDSFNAVTEEWVPIVTLWASVEPIRGREFFEAQRVNAEISHRIKVRYYPGITSKMRARFGERIFRIEAALNIEERNREIHLMCVEAV